ncbi:glycoside hydrolase family 140 protein [[Flexibacter] sp. ATCC 35208]|uniref:glycoside hydrolase family 140 protein n=1 Tax=[Flexibacter] sp. ATCC 35208 TaxID=1936242 RepID=UPI0009CE525E|nr:glycoside hydrolase family 140 protein [[Flexibacter] sp. ATCC 35208]OMP80361.1 glycoside hydrolase [[Flexibacter] sp. ATCC 35208]
MKWNTLLYVLLLPFLTYGQSKTLTLKVSKDGHFFQTSDGQPFFWLGDTGWLLFTNLNESEVDHYLADRQHKGFNVIQVMLLPKLAAVNQKGDSALLKNNIAEPQKKYFDFVATVVDKAAAKGLYLALVPVWGSPVKEGKVSPAAAATYAHFLATRFHDKKNIIWLNGGDIKGSDSSAVWNAIGNTLHKEDSVHLMTFHPRGRAQSSDWFHHAAWLNFNMFQSGHQRYNQDTTKRKYGEDNFRYVQADYKRTPAKPVLDGEPSYESIPQGLHDPKEPYWSDKDVRRYAYWSVFAGGAGFTYGHNSVIQFHKAKEKGVYGVREVYTDALNAPGAGQMKYLKQLLLSRSYFDRVPDQSLLAKDTGTQHQRILATRGKTYAFYYTATGRSIPVQLGKIEAGYIKASWYDPRTGYTSRIGTFPNKGVKVFDPPGKEEEGNDWVLILDRS